MMGGVEVFGGARIDKMKTKVQNDVDGERRGSEEDSSAHIALLVITKCGQQWKQRARTPSLSERLQSRMQDRKTVRQNSGRLGSRVWGLVSQSRDVNVNHLCEEIGNTASVL